MGIKLGKRYQIMRSPECCKIEDKQFDDFKLAVSFMLSAPFNTYLLDTKKNKIVAKNEI